MKNYILAIDQGTTGSRAFHFVFGFLLRVRACAAFFAEALRSAALRAAETAPFSCCRFGPGPCQPFCPGPSRSSCRPLSSC